MSNERVAGGILVGNIKVLSCVKKQQEIMLTADCGALTVLGLPALRSNAARIFCPISE